MTDAVESRFPRAARIIKEAIADELESQEVDRNDVTVLLRFPVTHSDAVVEAIVESKGEQWREPVVLASLEAHLGRLQTSLRSWLRGLKDPADDLDAN